MLLSGKKGNLPSEVGKRVKSCHQTRCSCVNAMHLDSLDDIGHAAGGGSVDIASSVVNSSGIAVGNTSRGSVGDSVVGGGAIGGTVRVAIAIAELGVGGGELLLGNVGGVLLVVVVDVEAKTSRVDVTVTEDQKSTEDRLGKQIENAVEYGLSVGRDDVATLAKTPCNGVESPEEGGEGTAVKKDSGNIGTESAGVATGLPDEHVKDVEQSGAAECEVAKLVRASDKSTNETGNNHDLVDENDKKNGRPRHTSGQEEIHEQEGSGDEPINVTDVEDLTVAASNNRVASDELDVDRSPAKIGAH